MLLSKHIEQLQKLLEEKGDQNVFMWVDTMEDTTYLVEAPELKVAMLNGEEYAVHQKLWNNDGEVLAIVNLGSGNFDEDKDCVQISFDFDEE